MKKITTLIAIMIFGAAVHAQETAESINRLGLEKFNKGDYTAAASHFERAVGLKPEYTSAHYNLGTAYYYLRRFEPAINSLQAAVRLDPTSVSINNQLGAVYLETGELDKAIVTFKRGVELKPDHVSVLYNLGCAYIRSGDFIAAIAPLEKARDLDPGNTEIRLNLAFALSQEKRLTDAIREMKAAVAAKPEDADLQFFLGNLYVISGDARRAAEQYDRLRKLDEVLARRLRESMSGSRVVMASVLTDK